MTTTPALAPYPYFTDATGTALDGGKIYIGTAGLDPRTNAIAVYQDVANTITWAQPLRTVSGYAAYQGAPSNFYPSSGSYSILVTTSTGTVIFRNLNVAVIDYAATGGAALIGANDASSGAKYTTVQGFITYLLSSAGSAIVSHISNLSGGTARTVKDKLWDVVTPEDFGATSLEGGLSNGAGNAAKFVTALASNRIVDGGGRTYALDGPIAPTAMVGIRNCGFKWGNTTIMATQNFLLSIIDKSNLVLENLTFDLGTVENCGSANDSTRGGLKISTTSEGVTYNDYLTVRNIRVFGYGNGTGVYIRSWRYSTFDGIKVYNRQVAASPDPSNDCQNGVDISIGKSGTISNIVSRDQTTRLAGTLTKRYSRGVLHFELQDCALTNYAIENVDQGLDLSGAITATLTKGNMGLSLSSMSATGCYTYGFKFANCSHDIAASGLVAREFGFVGFVFAGPNSTPVDATKNTQRIILTGCHAFDPTGTFTTNCYGFRMMESTASVGYPRGIRMVGCTSTDVSGGGHLYISFQNDVAYDGSGHMNEIMDCRSFGHTNAASNGFTYTVAQLPASVPVNTRVMVSDCNTTTFNAVAVGGGSSNVSVRYNTSTNDWRIG